MQEYREQNMKSITIDSTGLLRLKLDIKCECTTYIKTIVIDGREFGL